VDAPCKIEIVLVALASIDTPEEPPKNLVVVAVEFNSEFMTI
jgi:hypothetical protein